MPPLVTPAPSTMLQTTRRTRWLLPGVLILTMVVPGSATITDDCPDNPFLGLAGQDNSHVFYPESGQSPTVCLPSHVSTSNATEGPGDIYLQGTAAGGYHVSRTGGDIALNFSSTQYTVEDITSSCDGACLFLFSMAQEDQSHVGQEGYGTDIYLDLGEGPLDVDCTDCITPSHIEHDDETVTVDPAITGPDRFTKTVCLGSTCPTGGVCTIEDGSCSFTADELIDDEQPLWLQVRDEYVTSLHYLGTIHNRNFLQFQGRHPVQFPPGKPRNLLLRVQNLNDQTSTFTVELEDPVHLYPTFSPGQRKELTLSPDEERFLPITLQTRFCSGSCSGNVTARISEPTTGTLETEQRPYHVRPSQRVQAPAIKELQLGAILILAALIYRRLVLT